MSDKYCVFILTNNRPDRQLTIHTLRLCGYTGPIVLLVDDQDKQLQRYLTKDFGLNVSVHTFSKQEAINITDDGLNNSDYRAVVYARNINFSIAQELGYKYFIQLDDDYTNFAYNVVTRQNKLEVIKCTNLDRDFQLIFKYYRQSPWTSIALSQGGDFIGGAYSSLFKRIKRKVMNSFFCSTDRPFQFYGKINEDTTAYSCLGHKGDLFLTLHHIRLDQIPTQQNSGGLTDIYLDAGTYVKSFYSVMYCPSAVKVSSIGVTHRRIHHRINWDTCVPCIIQEKYKK